MTTPSTSPAGKTKIQGDAHLQDVADGSQCNDGELDHPRALLCFYILVTRSVVDTVTVNLGAHLHRWQMSLGNSLAHPRLTRRKSNPQLVDQT